ncbi:JAG1 [Mytilus coruscus]|uniref:JAG1 n=1 Tax=Mytilus coruscus TaxID=42192 RepID=A0A6J8BN14_MYTCO|nr:JAG1 [Mytilus coruscus]
MISYVSYKPNTISSVSETNLLRKNDKDTQHNDQLRYKAIISILKPPTLNQNIDDKNENKVKGRLMEYKCMTLNAENCVISSNTLQLTVEWISSNKTTKETAANTTQHFEYTCECNASNTGEHLPCNETMHTYYSNKTVYLRDPDKYAMGSFECVMVENDVSEKTTTPPDIELNSKCFIS